jgi:hypothetical protein
VVNDAVNGVLGAATGCALGVAGAIESGLVAFGPEVVGAACTVGGIVGLYAGYEYGPQFEDYET